MAVRQPLQVFTLLHHRMASAMASKGAPSHPEMKWTMQRDLDN